jgi:hypothetical protein
LPNPCLTRTGSVYLRTSEPLHGRTSLAVFLIYRYHAGMAPSSGDDDGRDWPEHPVREVEEIFQEAAVVGCIIFRLNGVYTVTSPSVFPWIVFPVRVPDASSIRQHMIADLRRQLKRMLASEVGGQG